MFIEVHEFIKTGENKEHEKIKKRLLNVDFITEVFKRDDGTVAIHCVAPVGAFYDVKESYNEIRMMLEAVSIVKGKLWVG